MPLTDTALAINAQRISDVQDDLFFKFKRIPDEINNILSIAIPNNQLKY
ncbi:hypothetical protein D593_0285 [Streptococcus intermedius BA1]|nr:hypothetical protein D593_0285 [Streptococcus intermedius BA1]